jgi:hypothetical protein
VGDTLKITYVDEINTTRSARVATDTASVVETVVPTPTPTPTPTVTPSITPTPVVCDAEKLSVSPISLKLKRNKSGDVTVTVTGADGCAVEGETVTATINKAGRKLIEISSTEEDTNSQGEAAFEIEALNKTGVAQVKFKAGNLRKTLKVSVKK